MMINIAPKLSTRWRRVVAFSIIVAGLACLPVPGHVHAAEASAPAVDPMASLTHDPLAEKGKIRCSDGTSRSFSGDNPSDLVVASLCSESAGVAEERHRRASIAVEAKNKDARLRAALHGDQGVWAGLAATWETGRLDYLLSFRLIWYVGLALGVLLLARLLGSRR